ncbi:MAG: RNA 2',3'-cyclic phosphodiesterase [Bacillota bacterium]
MRVFVAIDFDSRTKSKILKVQKKLQENVQKARFTPKENFHLTLVFIGQTDANDIKLIIDAIEKINFLPFEITFEGVSKFERGRKNILWMGIRESKELERINKELWKNIVGKGFSLQKRKFIPHITLARDVAMKNDNKLYFAPFSYSVDAISLMYTDMSDSQVTYKELYKMNFAKSNNNTDTKK